MGLPLNSTAARQSNTNEITSPDQIQDLLEAARYADMDDVMSLSSAGVSLDSKDSQGRTAWRLQQVMKSKYPNALHMAAANGHLDIVEYLLQNGADGNASNTEKNTPLHWACLNGHTEVARALIRGGASVSMLNSYDRTPMDEAVSQGKLELVDAINAAVAEFELNGVEVS